MAGRRAAYFQPRSDYFGRPFDDGIIGALLDAGYEIDLYAPGSPESQDLCPPAVRCLNVEYRRSWLAANLGRMRWRSYTLFLGNPDLGTACAAMLARMAGRPFVNAVDEIYAGGYEGPALGWWKRAARWGAGQARFTIITDLCRVDLQSSFARLGRDHSFLDYPACFSNSYAGESREAVRASLGIYPDEFIVSLAGAVTAGNGADWIFRQLNAIDARLLIQPGVRPDPVLESLIERLVADGRVLYLPERVSYLRAAELTMAADAALVLYRSPKPQFQQMGVSSQKLDVALWLGIPVVATRQASFAFIEDIGCGILIEAERDLPAAIRRIRSDRDSFSMGARRAIDEYVQPAMRRKRLAEAFDTIR